jgi:outer membrane protein insertion porin family
MKAFLPIVLGVCLLPVQGLAQTRTRKAPAKAAASPKPPKPAAALDLFPIRRIQIKGNKLLTASQIQAEAALPIGKPVGKAEFDAARDRLLATGYFESVQFQFGPVGSTADAQYEATFDVVEVPSVYPVQFENLPVPAAELEADLKAHNIFYGAKVPGTQQVLGGYARQIEQALAARNKPTRVIAELTPVGKDDFKILFRSAEPLPPVAHVTFTGNKALSAIVLQNAINDVAFGSPFSQDHFRQLLDNQVRPLYEAKGMIRVAFPAFTSEPAPKVRGLLVHVAVEEGPVYNLKKITLAGVDPDYEEYLKIKPGGVANFDELKEALDRVKNQMKRNGYLDTDGTLERKIDDKAHTVDVIVQMVPGAQFTMGKLTIVGLDLNSEPVVRKLWILEEGKPFNARYPDYFLTRIREDGLFDGLGDTKSAVERNDATHVVDVTLKFGASPKPKPKRRPGLMGEDPATDPVKPGPPPV